jgi:hypothetical protein
LYVVPLIVADEGASMLADSGGVVLESAEIPEFVGFPFVSVVKAATFDDADAPEQVLFVNRFAAPIGKGTAIAVVPAIARTLTFPSVKLDVAVEPLDPVAVTEYVATNQSGSVNESPMSPVELAVTSTSRTHVWPALSFTLMCTASPGCQLPPRRLTVEPGA